MNMRKRLVKKISTLSVISVVTCTTASSISTTKASALPLGICGFFKNLSQYRNTIKIDGISFTKSLSNPFKNVSFNNILKNLKTCNPFKCMSFSSLFTTSNVPGVVSNASDLEDVKGILKNKPSTGNTSNMIKKYVSFNETGILINYNTDDPPKNVLKNSTKVSLINLSR